MMKLGRKTYSWYHNKVYPRVSHLRGANFLLRNLRRCSYKGKTTEIDYLNYNLKINPEETHGRKLYRGEIHEPVVTNYIKQNIEPGDTVLELGGHRGTLSVIISDIIGPEGELYVFEPNQENLEFLKYNLSAYNSYVQIIEKAVSSKSGRGKNLAI